MLIAQEDPTGIVATYWPAAAVILPLLVALATRANAQRYVKYGVAGGFALAAAVLTALQYDWSAATFEMIVMRAGVIFAAAQATYATVDLLVRKALGADVGLNDLAVVNPERGFR